MQFRLLGAVEAETATGRVIMLRRQRDRCMFAVLLLKHGRVVPVADLVELLWGDAPPAKAVAGTHSHVSRVRAALATDPELIDACRFDQLVRQAQALGQPEQRSAC